MPPRFHTRTVVSAPAAANRLPPGWNVTPREVDGCLFGYTWFAALATARPDLAYWLAEVMRVADRAYDAQAALEDQQQVPARPPVPAPNVANRELAALLPRLAELVGPERAASFAGAARQSGDANLAALVAQLTTGLGDAAGIALAPQAVAAAAAALPSGAELAERIVRCIGIYETNRGPTSTEPKPRESDLDTIAGLPASMATVEQATMPYAVDVLRRNPALWIRASPPLTKGELDDAASRCQGVAKLSKAVAVAAGKGATVEEFVASQRKLVTQSGLPDSEVRQMFEAVELKASIDEAHTEYVAAKGKKAKRQAVTDAIAALSDDDRLGLDDASLSAYIKNPRKWGENRAAWQRLAVNAMPGNLGARIEAIAESHQGTALAVPEYTRRVEQAMKANPKVTAAELVTQIGATNNPGEAGYGDHIWQIYQRLYGAAK